MLATMIWGSTFVAQSVGMDHIGPFTFQAVRCGLGVIGLIPMIWVADRRKKDGKTFVSRWKDATLWRAGLLCGLPLFAAVNLQQVGLVYSTAGKAAFITAMYILIVPILGLLLGKKISPIIPVSLVLAVAGLYLLSAVDSGGSLFADLALIGCALMFAVQILFVDHFAPSVDPLRLNCIQALVSTVISFVFMFLLEKPQIADLLRCWLPLCYAGFLSMGVAYSLQIIGQQTLEPTAASLIMSLESAFAVLFAWILLNETMSPNEATGCILVFAGVILSQIPIPIRKKQA